MLVLSRRKGEKIVLFTDQGRVEIEVVRIRGDSVRIGVVADKSVTIAREELIEDERRPGGTES